MAITYEALMSTIAQVAAAEKITKEGLRTLSRDMLSYVLETEDVRPVNALLGQGEDGKFILTPINWRIAVQYFAHFIAFTSNYEEEVKPYAVKGKGKRTPLVFNKKSKKKWDKCANEIAAWLEDEGNDIWVWSNNAEMDAQPVDYAKKITQAIQTAVSEEKGDMSMNDVMAAVMAADGVDIHGLLAAMEAMRVPEAEAEAV